MGAHSRYLVNTTELYISYGNAALFQITLTTCQWRLPSAYPTLCYKVMGLWKNNYGLWKNNLLTLPQTQDFSGLHCHGTGAANCGQSDGHIH